MRKAIIDLGTNTFNLLVFEQNEGTPIIIHNDRIPVGLGMGGINESIISSTAFDRGCHAMQLFKQTCDKMEVTEIKAFGTSALRGATNRTDFLKSIKDTTGIFIEVIEGKREAELIYNGVRHVHQFDQLSCIMDIGGGSTEFILVDQHLRALESFNIGVARILQLFELKNPLTDNNLHQIDLFFQTHTAGFFNLHNCPVLVGASGSFETFYELIYEEKFDELWSSKELPFYPLMSVLDSLIYSTQEERNHNPRIADLRKNMIHIAAFKTKWVIEKLGVNAVWLSPASLKEGVMFELCR